MTRVVLVPGVLALLPEYAGVEDPVAHLRAACVAAVEWLGPAPRVVASSQGARVAAALVSAGPEAGSASPAQPTDGVLVVANGTATRGEKAPGHLDVRAAAFDDDLGLALIAEPDRLRHLDLGLAAELWADVDGLVRLGEEMALDARCVDVDYDDDPFGVRYWVIRWRAARRRSVDITDSPGRTGPRHAGARGQIGRDYPGSRPQPH